MRYMLLGLVQVFLQTASWEEADVTRVRIEGSEMYMECHLLDGRTDVRWRRFVDMFVLT